MQYRPAIISIRWNNVETHSRKRMRNVPRRMWTPSRGAISVFIYTEDMYKMMRDTNRQLEDSIGPAVPVCIASGRSPVTRRAGVFEIAGLLKIIIEILFPYLYLNIDK